MRLEWKYTLILNGFILIVMSIFFVIDDRMLEKESIWSVIRDYTKGAAMRDIADEIQKRIAGEYDADKLAKLIRSIDLQKMGWEVVDINVADSNGVIIASLTGEALYTQLSSDELKKVMSGQMRVRYPPEGYFGHWVVEYTLPYVVAHSPDEGKTELGALQILFSAQDIMKYSRQLRTKHLFYIAIVTIALTVFINPLTSYLIVRRLERLMDAIAAAQAGDFAARARDSSRDEIGRLSRGFNRMLEQISSEHARRLEALGNLAAGVAHEVRNPLNSIAMTIQYLKDIMQDTQKEEKNTISGSISEAHECLDVIARKVKELDRIVEEFIQLTRPAEMNWKSVDLNVFLDDMLRDFASSFGGASVKLITNYSGEPLYARIDQDKLRQAVSNIILNGVQAMPAGGELHVTTSRDASQNAGVIEIRDTGVGISQENIDRVFEPYFTTKPDGTGLGLTITYRIIEAHGGEIKVESEEGQGAAFTIFLPLLAISAQLSAITR